MESLPFRSRFTETRAHADVIAEIGELVSSVAEIGDVYPRFADLVDELIAFDRLSISSVDSMTGILEVVYVDGIYLPDHGAGIGHRLDGTLVGSVIASGRVVGIDGDGLCVNGRANWPGADELTAAGLQSILVAPLMNEGSLVGVMLMARKDPNGFATGELALAGRIASQISGPVAAELQRNEADREAVEKDAMADLVSEIDLFLLDSAQGSVNNPA